jgi:hypothetical protein
MLAFIEVYAEPKDLGVAPSAALDHEILHAVILTHHRLSAKPELRFSLILVLYFGGGRAEAGRLPNAWNRAFSFRHRGSVGSRIDEPDCLSALSKRVRGSCLPAELHSFAEGPAIKPPGVFSLPCSPHAANYKRRKFSARALPVFRTWPSSKPRRMPC